MHYYPINPFIHKLYYSYKVTCIITLHYYLKLVYPCLILLNSINQTVFIDFLIPQKYILFAYIHSKIILKRYSDPIIFQ